MKRLIIVAICLTLLTCFAGCNKQANTQPASVENKKPMEITGTTEPVPTAELEVEKVKETGEVFKIEKHDIIGENYIDDSEQTITPMPDYMDEPQEEEDENL